MEALRSSKTSVTIHQSARRNIPEEITLHQHSCEILINTTIYDY